MLATNKRFAVRQQESEVFNLIKEDSTLDGINSINDASDDDSDDDTGNSDGNEDNESDDFEESEHEAFVKKLRKMPYKNLFKLNNKEIPQLSCETRWNSWYYMVLSLKSQKEFICSITKNDKECAIPNETWNFIDNFVVGFEPMSQLTLALQSSQLTFGDFYLLWLRCKLLLEKTDTPLSRQLLTKMKNRESALTDNKAFLAAIYLDQRINYRDTPLISEEQRQCALEHLKQTWRSIQRVAHGGLTNVSMEDPIEGLSSNDDILESFFRSHEVSHDSNISTCLFDELEDLSRLPRLKLERGQSILDFWYSQKQGKPDMYSLAAVVLSTPATQVSTERAFSTLAFILTKLRTRLSETTLSNILLIRLNAELFQQLNI
ncbi:uncharacterized protein LOC135715364 [Ochlerotatus camptorhynchus]|uniref:uncharacterized protein LOC135715364 n=1 Tax=Ochlerotatus camptorhynchus TaxID=644619 RepID=UPI0031D1ED0C